MSYGLAITVDEGHEVHFIVEPQARLALIEALQNTPPDTPVLLGSITAARLFVRGNRPRCRLALGGHNQNGLPNQRFSNVRILRNEIVQLISSQSSHARDAGPIDDEDDRETIQDGDARFYRQGLGRDA